MVGLASLSPAVLWSLAAILGVLVVAQGFVALQRPSRDAGLALRPHHTELALRVRTWWVLFAIFGIGLVLGTGFTMTVLAFTSFLALREYFSLVSSRSVDRRAMFWAFLAIPLQFWWAWIEWYGMFIVFVPVYAALFVQTRLILLRNTDGFLHSASTIHWGLMTTVYGLSHTAYLLVMPNGGPGWVLALFVLTQANDVAQYVWGRSLGGPKVIPAVSPGKTWAGLLGGVATTVVLATLLAPYWTALDRVEAAFVGLLIGVGGFFGDLCISCLKRDLGVKDTGRLLPGHGGILDRVDSLTFTAPLFFHVCYWLHG